METSGHVPLRFVWIGLALVGIGIAQSLFWGKHFSLRAPISKDPKPLTVSLDLLNPVF